MKAIQNAVVLFVLAAAAGISMEEGYEACAGLLVLSLIFCCVVAVKQGDADGD